MTRAFVDANIPMYAAGSPHPLREPAMRVLELAAERPAAFVTSAEVLQELLHRRLSPRGWPVGREVFAAFVELMRERIEPVLAEDVERAARLADATTGADARDLLHAAVMRRLGLTRIITTDRGFDAIEGVTRLDPAHLDSWVETLA